MQSFIELCRALFKLSFGRHCGYGKMKVPHICILLTRFWHARAGMLHGAPKVPRIRAKQAQKTKHLSHTTHTRSSHHAMMHTIERRLSYKQRIGFGLAFVPCTRLPTPCASRPNSFADERAHICYFRMFPTLLSSWIKNSYFSRTPETVSRAAFASVC